MTPNDICLYYAIAALYSGQYVSEDFTWGWSKSVLKQIDCWEIVEACEEKRGEQQIDGVVYRIAQSGFLDIAMCEKIKTSRGLQQIILGGFHDAGIAELKNTEKNLFLTLDLDSGQVIDNVWYRKVAKITFKNVFDQACDANVKDLVGLSVQKHLENFVDKKLYFSFVLADTRAASSPDSHSLSLFCDDVQVEYCFVND